MADFIDIDEKNLQKDFEEKDTKDIIIKLLNTQEEYFESIFQYNQKYHNDIVKNNSTYNNKLIEKVNEATNLLNNELITLKEIIRTNNNLKKDLIRELSKIQENRTEDEEKNSIIYRNAKNGIIQFSIQLAITIIILLVILGGYNLVKIIL